MIIKESYLSHLWSAGQHLALLILKYIWLKNEADDGFVLAIFMKKINIISFEYTSNAIRLFELVVIKPEAANFVC